MQAIIGIPFFLLFLVVGALQIYLGDVDKLGYQIN